MSRWGSSWGGWSKPALLTGWVTANSIYPSRSWLTLGGTARLVLVNVWEPTPFYFSWSTLCKWISISATNLRLTSEREEQKRLVGCVGRGALWGGRGARGALWGQRQALPLCTQLLFISQACQWGHWGFSYIAGIGGVLQAFRLDSATKDGRLSTEMLLHSMYFRPSLNNETLYCISKPWNQNSFSILEYAFKVPPYRCSQLHQRSA